MSAVSFLLALVLAPFMLGVINRVKAVFAGRRGRPLLQSYYDLSKLLRKGAVYSETTTWMFRAGPIVSLTSAIAAAAIMPIGGTPSLFSFPGDFILLVYLFALGRFFTVAAALDTGSAFEGMGASREAFFSALAEPTMLLGLVTIARRTLDAPLGPLSDITAGVTVARWFEFDFLMLLVAVAFVIVYLAENSRIPIDDPNTHLELTMIHEVMILDHGGPDLAYIQYGAALKLWVLGVLIVGFVVPKTGSPMIDIATALAGTLALAVLVGVIESTMARLRLTRVPQLLITAVALTVLALALGLRG